MNGGHYLTKGHVILCLLYIKTNLMSRNILEAAKTRFSNANSRLLQGRSAPSTPAFWMDHKRPCNASCFLKAGSSGSGVFFLTQKRARSLADFAPVPLRSH
jgi:hypothetical protein